MDKRKNTPIENREIFNNDISCCLHELLAEEMPSIAEPSLELLKTEVVLPDGLAQKGPQFCSGWLPELSGHDEFQVFRQAQQLVGSRFNLPEVLLLFPSK